MDGRRAANRPAWTRPRTPSSKTSPASSGEGSRYRLASGLLAAKDGLDARGPRSSRRAAWRARHGRRGVVHDGRGRRVARCAAKAVGRHLRARRWDEDAPRDIATLAHDRAPTLLCGDHDAFVLGEGDDDLTDTAFSPAEAGARPSLVAIREPRTFGDEQTIAVSTRPSRGATRSTSCASAAAGRCGCGRSRRRRRRRGTASSTRCPRTTTSSRSTATRRPRSSSTARGRPRTRVREASRCPHGAGAPGRSKDG